MKVYEYLAAGLPVVATPLPALARRRGRGHCGRRRGHRRATARRRWRSDSPARRRERSALAARRTRGTRGSTRSARRWRRRERTCSCTRCPRRSAAEPGCAPTGRPRSGGAGASTSSMPSSARRSRAARLANLQGLDSPGRARPAARAARWPTAAARAAGAAGVRPRRLAGAGRHGGEAGRTRPGRGRVIADGPGGGRAALASRAGAPWSTSRTTSSRPFAAPTRAGHGRCDALRAANALAAVLRVVDGQPAEVMQGALAAGSRTRRCATCPTWSTSPRSRPWRRPRAIAASCSWPTSGSRRTRGPRSSCADDGAAARCGRSCHDARLTLAAAACRPDVVATSGSRPAASSTISRAPTRAPTVAIVPLLTGGGSPLKFVEALAYGLPVVATPAAAAGLDVEPETHYLAADGPLPFAQALVRVLEHGAAGMAGRGRSLVEERYSIETLTGLLSP